MIAWFKRWIADRKRAKILRLCREDGHYMEQVGDMTPGKMVNGAPIPTGRAEFRLFACRNKCGHGEINDVGKKSYRRDYEEGERIKQEASKEKK